jgi:hypothetical protein
VNVPTRAWALVGLTAAALAAFGGTTQAAMRAGGFGPTTLQITTTTDTLPGAAAIGYLALPGQPVARTYTLTNASEATLVGVSVSDPNVRRGAVRCAGHRGAITLAAWSSVVCHATFPAVAGIRRNVVTARGRAEGTGYTLEGSAVAGYRAGVDTLTLSESLDAGNAGNVGNVGNVGNARSAAAQTRSAIRAVQVRYVVSVSGPTPLLNVSVGETLPVIGLACPPGGSVIGSLNPSADAHCTAQWNAAPGAYTGQATAAGTESLRSISSRGPGPARVAQAAVSSHYQFALPAPPRQSSGAATPGGGSSSATGKRHPFTSAINHASGINHASAVNHNSAAKHGSAAGQLLSGTSTATGGAAHPPAGGSAPVGLAASPGANQGANPGSSSGNNPGAKGGAKPPSHAKSGTDQTQSLLHRNKHSELPLLFFLLLVVLPAMVTLVFGGSLRRRRR